jgi:uncharacterized DUF497 family protein
MEFDWDNGNWPKCGKHGMTKEEVEFVVEFAATVLPDQFPREVRWRAIGHTSPGKHRDAFVVFTIRGEKVRPISARPMHRKEFKRYV